MTDHADTTTLLRLVTWMSPAFPIGAFSYSGGLEQAVHDGLISCADDLRTWLACVIQQGTGWNDAVLLAEAWRAVGDVSRLGEVADLAQALTGSAERYRETMLQGEAFLEAARNWPHALLDTFRDAVAYPVAVGAVGGAHSVGIEPLLAAYLHATLSNLVSVAIRCSVTGQKQGVAILAAVEPVIAKTAVRASKSTLDDLGSATMVADIASLRHETLHSRLFRS